MIQLSLKCLLLSSLLGQKIFEEFEKEQNNKYQYNETYRFDWVPNNGSYTLSVENVEGDIIVNGHQGRGIEMYIEHKIHAKTEKRAKRFVEQNKINVYHIDNNLIQIKSDEKMKHRRNGSIIFNLDLPNKIQLKLETLGGNINVKHIQGELYLKTNGGDIELKNLSGRIDAKTSGGDVEIGSVEGLVLAQSSKWWIFPMQPL